MPAKLWEQEQLRLEFRPTCADAPHGQVLESFYFGSYDGRKASAVWQDLEKRWPGQNSEGYDLSKVYSSLRMSVLVIAGKRDVIQPESTLTIAKIANAKLIFLNNSGHWSFLEEPAPFHDAVVNFLDHTDTPAIQYWRTSKALPARRAFAAGG